MSEKFGSKLVILLISVLVSTALAVEKPATLQKTCVTEECHTDFNKKTHVHGPVSLGDCKSCHKVVDPNKHSFRFVRKGNDLCEYCHLDQAIKKVVHEPLKTGDCVKCHDPHSSDNKFLLPRETVSALCQDCHQTGKDLKFPHGPVAVGECTICHDSHSSDHKNLLTTEPGELCFSCHVVTKDELSKFEFIHEPVKEHCVGCHDPHGADNSKMVKDVAPFMCYKCHKDIEKVAEESDYQHSVVTDVDGCMHCHTPHASTVKFLLKKDAESLCMTCHDKPQGISKDKVLPPFTDELKDKKYLHGPVKDKDCSGCHVTHGSQYFSLLAKDYPPVFYSPFSEDNYALCFSCHAKDVVWMPKTDNLTDFRNGDVNLHYLHVNKERRGRTCRACHATHASNQARHIRKSVPYGIWDLPVGFTKTETGGSCKSGCHLPKDYDRINPVDYSVPRPVSPGKKASEKATDGNKQSDENEA